MNAFVLMMMMIVLFIVLSRIKHRIPLGVKLGIFGSVSSSSAFLVLLVLQVRYALHFSGSCRVHFSGSCQIPE